jgi:hypothetical protein
MGVGVTGCVGVGGTWVTVGSAVGVDVAVGWAGVGDKGGVGVIVTVSDRDGVEEGDAVSTTCAAAPLLLLPERRAKNTMAITIITPNVTQQPLRLSSG